MSFAVVQNVTSSGSGTASVAIDNVQGGNDLLVFVSTVGNATPGINSVTLDGADITAGALLAWSTGAYSSGGQYFGMGVYLVKNSGTGTHTASATVSYSGWVVTIQTAEVSAGLGAIDVASGIATGNSTTGATVQISPTSANDVVLAVLAAYGTPGSVAGSGFTEIGQVNTNPDAFWEYQAQGAPTPVTPSIGLGTAAPWGMASLAVRYVPPSIVLTIGSSVVAPAQAALATATSGGTIAASTPFYTQATALNAHGETIASNEETITTGSGTSTNTVTMSLAAPVPNATGYRFYYGDASAQENRYFETTGNSSTSFTYDGSQIPVAAVPPSSNTTGLPLAEGATAIPFTGENFESGMSASILQGTNTVAQSNVVYTDATDGTFDLVMEPMSGPQLAATDSVYSAQFKVTVAENVSVSFPVQLTPPTGVLFKTLLSVIPAAPMRFETLPDLAVNDQVWAAGNSTGTAAAPAGLVLNSDGSFEFAPGYTPQDFWVRVYIAADSAYTPWSKIAVTSIQSGGFW